ncbi:MAG: SDR family oxidoreductase [bacterium]|nr:SDR family oxidoreductase [bacterium]
MSDFTSFNNKTVVVTGAAGFLGSHLCDALIAAGAKVIGVDNFLTGDADNLTQLSNHDHFVFVEADVNQQPSSYLPANEKIECIFHFASPASPPLYQAHPVETYLVNSMATHQLLQYLLQHNPAARFVFASTSEIYGDPEIHPQVESYWGNVNPNGIRSCYDEAKRLGETICGVHQRDFEMDVRIVRIFNTYGPRMDINDGRVIPNFIKQILNQQPLELYGDGTQTRSFCYVDDLINGIMKLASVDAGSGKSINIGNPTEFTMLEAVAVLESITGTKLETVFKPLPQDDPVRRKPDITLAKHVLEWQPTISFEEGLKKTIEYFRQRA